MTIAACHLSPEGVIFGADSTSTITGGGKTYYLDHEQKLFEVGPRKNSSIGLVTWGAGRIGKTSHRTMSARLAKSHAEKRFSSVKEMADQLSANVWAEVEASFGREIARAKELLAKSDGATDFEKLTPEEFDELVSLSDRAGGYFIGGRVGDAEECDAYSVEWRILDAAPVVQQLGSEQAHFKGVPQMMQRLIFGCDDDLFNRLSDSGKWGGTPQELAEILTQSRLIHPQSLPLREAIDWIHTVIHTTIRAVKFAGWHYCGGPVEVAAITTDRPFRWV